MNQLKHTEPFLLESGVVLPELDIAYSTYGTLNAAKDNVIWVCHALTANSEALDWWSGLIGENRLFDPKNYFIVCANMLGSCYGATSPTSINPVTGKPYGKSFPLITVRDMVHSHQILQRHLGIQKVQLALGGSMGGQQVVEWAIIDPKLFERVAIIASNAKHSPWGIAFNEAQRMAIFADSTLYDDTPEAGKKGLEAARAIGMLSYRNYDTYGATQGEQSDDKLDDFRASSYQRYQGLKLWSRFNALAYISLSRSMDSHNVGRGRGGVENALRQIKSKTLVVGIQSDILFPIEEQIFMAQHIPNAKIEIIDSLYGHDGFLIEYEALTEKLQAFLADDLSAFDDTPLNGKLALTRKVGIPGTESF